MSLKIAVHGPTGVGKTLFALSMAQLGPIGIVDTEFAYDWYLDKTDESKTSYVIKPHICKLLGITRSPATVLCVQTQDINVVKGFFFAAGPRPDVVGGVHDTIHVN